MANRTTTIENRKLILYAQVDGICPKCTTQLMYEKNGSPEKLFEIAHIYPLNAKPMEITLLKDEERLSSDLNHIDNLICLCVSCHTKFDKPRTVEEYREVIQIKKNLIRLNNEKSIWGNTKVNSEINEIIEFLSNSEFDVTSVDTLNYDPKTIEDKTDASITFLTKRNIHRHVQDYYHGIKTKFIELDNIAPTTTENISSQIKTHYLALKKNSITNNQKEIFDAMVAWLKRTTKQQTDEASEIIISYFIQNCEVFE